MRISSLTAAPATYTVAAPAPPAAPPASGARDTFEVRRGSIAAAPEQLSPAGKFVSQRGRDLLAIAGAMSISWNLREETTVQLNLVEGADADAAAALLEREVEGITVRIGIFGSREPYTPSPVPPRVSSLVRSVAAMSGVWDYRYSDTAPTSHGRVTFSAMSADVVARLDPLLRNRLAWGNLPSGDQRWMYVSWRAPRPSA